jgi:hypothetical protein
MDFGKIKAKIKAAGLTTEDRELLKKCTRNGVIMAGFGGFFVASTVGWLLTKKNKFTPRVRLIVASLSMVFGVYGGAALSAAHCLQELAHLDTPLGQQARNLFIEPTVEEKQEKKTEEPDDFEK